MLFRSAGALQISVAGLKDEAIKIKAAEEAMDLLVEIGDIEELSNRLRRVLESVIDPEED